MQKCEVNFLKKKFLSFKKISTTYQYRRGSSNLDQAER